MIPPNDTLRVPLMAFCQDRNWAQEQRFPTWGVIPQKRMSPGGDEHLCAVLELTYVSLLDS
jgi:hypothetical protein